MDVQLEAFGSGLEITVVAAIPAGSGLGTSSILAATVLGAISDFCGLAWDKNEIGNRTFDFRTITDYRRGDGKINTVAYCTV